MGSLGVMSMTAVVHVHDTNSMTDWKSGGCQLHADMKLYYEHPDSDL
jgi:hypothetical protein